MLGLPQARNFPDISTISVLKFVSENNFLKCYKVQNFDRKETTFNLKQCECAVKIRTSTFAVDW